MSRFNRFWLFGFFALWAGMTNAAGTSPVPPAVPLALKWGGDISTNTTLAYNQTGQQFNVSQTATVTLPSCVANGQQFYVTIFAGGGSYGTVQYPGGYFTYPSQSSSNPGILILAPFQSASFSCDTTDGAAYFVTNENGLFQLNSSYAVSFVQDAYNPAQLQIQNNGAGENVLSLYNKNSSGYSALTFTQVDLAYPDTGEPYEHGAYGFGASLAVGGFNDSGVAYDEISRYTQTNNAFISPSRWVRQQTGGVIQAETVVGAAFTSGSTTATAGGNTGGGYAAVWPANGSLVYPLLGNVLPSGTTIVSGGGTATAVLSNAALGTYGFVPVDVGTPVYKQYTSEVWQEMGKIEWFSYANSQGLNGSFASAILAIDRQNGDVALNEPDSVIPQALLDVNGNDIIGNGDQTDRHLYSTAQLNVETASADMFSLFQTGVNSIHATYAASPARIGWKDSNNAVYPLTMAMDGTGDAEVQGSLNVGSTSENAGASGSINSVGGYYLNGVLTISPTAPGITTGFGTGDAISGANGTSQWMDTVGSSPSTSATFSTATFAHGLACGANDLTTSTILVRETARTTTSVTFKTYSATTGTLTAPTAADVILIGPCQGG